MSGQLGFDALLADAEHENAARALARETAHLPGTMDEALVYYRTLIERHHAAMLAADVDAVMALREDACRLAFKLNHGAPGIIADEDAPGCVLEARTAAPSGTVPLWGQVGDFIVTVGAMRVRVELDGIFGIGSRSGFWHGFSAHAVDHDKPFLSETGYRSFLGLHADTVSGVTPARFVQAVIERHVARELKGRLVAIASRWREL